MLFREIAAWRATHLEQKGLELFHLLLSFLLLKFPPHLMQMHFHLQTNVSKKA